MWDLWGIYELSKAQSVHTLRKGALVVMIQECSFATGMRARLVRELKEMYPEYWFVFEAGKDKETNALEIYVENKRGSAWHTDKRYCNNDVFPY
jgi:hypothetical protein